MNCGNFAGLALPLLAGIALYGQGSALERLQKRVDAAQKQAQRKTEQAQKKIDAAQQKAGRVTTAPQASPGPHADARASAESISGVYTGYYTCAQGHTPLKLILTAHPDGALEGAFAFEPPGGVPGGGIESAYALKGRYTASTGQFQLNPDRWLMRAPIGYQIAGISGTYNSQTAALQGLVAAPGCKSLEVKKDGALSAQLQSQAAATGREMQNLPPGVIATGRSPQTCMGFMSWTTRAVQEYPGVDLDRVEMSALLARLTNLFEDQHFTRFFGKPFDQIPASERSRLWMQVIRPCFENPAFGRAAAWQSALQYAFVPGTNQSQVLGEAIEHRRLRLELAAAVQPLLASAQGFGGLTALERFSTQQKELFASLDPGMAAAYRQRIATRANELMAVLVAQERTHLESLPPGLHGLAKGAAWYRTVQDKFKDWHEDVVKQLTRAFLATRNQLAVDSEPELLQLIRQAKTPETVAAVLGTYLPLRLRAGSRAVRLDM